MAKIGLTKDFKDEKLREELRRYDLLEVLKNDMSTMEILILNDVITRYLELSSIDTDDGVYKIYNYANVTERYKEIFQFDSALSKAKVKLIEKGFIKEKKGAFYCPTLGHCKIALKLVNKKVMELVY